MSYEIEKDWITDAGLRAVVIMSDLGHRCGYVGVPQNNPLYGIKYNERTQVLTMDMNRSTEKMSPIQVLLATVKSLDELRSPEYVFEVHGGLTYSGGSGKYPVESDDWWFGYDCGHASDAPAPGARMSMFSFNDGVHRTLDYCIDECESLAKQIVDKTTPTVQHLPADDTEGGEA